MNFIKKFLLQICYIFILIFDIIYWFLDFFELLYISKMILLLFPTINSYTSQNLIFTLPEIYVDPYFKWISNLSEKYIPTIATLYLVPYIAYELIYMLRKFLDIIYLYLLYNIC